MNTIKKIGTLVSLLSISNIVAPAATTILTFGGPGYISQGNTYTYNAAGSSAAARDGGVAVNFFFFFQTSECYIDFAAPRGTLLEIGTYTDVVQYMGQPVVGTPSMSIMNIGKVLSPIPEGWFKVLEIAIDPVYGTPTKVAVDFVVYDSAGQYTAGSARWGSNIPVTPINQLIPEVSTSFLLMTTLGFVACRRRRT